MHRSSNASTFILHQSKFPRLPPKDDHKIFMQKPLAAQIALAKKDLAKTLIMKSMIVQERKNTLLTKNSIAELDSITTQALEPVSSRSVQNQKKKFDFNRASQLNLIKTQEDEVHSPRMDEMRLDPIYDSDQQTPYNLILRKTRMTLDRIAPKNHEAKNKQQTVNVFPLKNEQLIHKMSIQDRSIDESQEEDTNVQDELIKALRQQLIDSKKIISVQQESINRLEVIVKQEANEKEQLQSQMKNLENRVQFLQQSNQIINQQLQDAKFNIIQINQKLADKEGELREKSNLIAALYEKEKKQPVVQRKSISIRMQSELSVNFQAALVSYIQNSKKKIQPLITCKICTKLLSDPITFIPCAHSYCGKCIGDNVQGQCRTCGPYSNIEAAYQNDLVEDLKDAYLIMKEMLDTFDTVF